jgi:hypothetical protein
VLGLGWSLDLPAIERSTRAGIPRAGGPAVWQLRHLGDGEELTETAPGIYRQRIEQGAPIVVRALPGGAMSALATDGTGYLFGLTDDARLVGDAGPVRLELSAITDVHGNRIDFTYTREAGSDAPLLSAITWNDGRARVVLDYEARPDLTRRARAPGLSARSGCSQMMLPSGQAAIAWLKGIGASTLVLPVRCSGILGTVPPMLLTHRT